MSSPVSTLGLASSPAATGYFVDQKKGEVNELKQVVYDWFACGYDIKDITD